MATTTFLFVDQVGSTEQLTALGDEVAHERRTTLVGALRDAVAAHGGHEVDSAGDGLFCAFEGAAEAVGAAVAMQQVVEALGRREPEPRRLGVRVGLHAGEPLRGVDGGYFGAAVVVAARLCGRAGAGQVLASELVRSLVEPRGTQAFTAVGPLELKGVPAPVVASTVDWLPLDDDRALPAGLTATDGTPFVGRERELSRLRAALASVEDGGRRLVLLSGESGSGVTRTVAEGARSAAADGATVWFGRASGGDGELGAWAQALSTWAEVVPRATARWALGGRGHDLGRLSRVVADLAPSREVTATSAAAATFVVADALDDLLARLSTWAPVVVVLDHLEDADPATLAVLERLARSPRRNRLLLLACYATSGVGSSQVLAALSSVPGTVDVRLGPLSSAEVSAVVEAATGHLPSEATVRAIRSESEGLPYFVQQMALSQREKVVLESVAEAVDRAEELRGDLRLRREEISLGLRELEQLRVGAASAASAAVEPDGTPPADVPCPYRGLLAFGADDAEWFSGRDVLVAELVARLATSRFLAVVGPSGSGKSSAVRAGLLPALARGDVAGSAAWRAAVCIPGADPLGALAGALAGLRGGGADAAVLREGLLTRPLADVVREAADGQPVVVVVDQAEELWTSSPAADRDRTIDLLTGTVAQDGASGVVVVLAMRADYYGQASAHPALAALMTESQVLVGPLTDAGLRAVVEAPARRAGLVLEPGLAQAVVDDAGGQPGALPLVSTALLETWHRRRGSSLTLAGYAEAGGVRSAIARLADATYDDLPELNRDAARRLLLRLAAPGVDGDDVARHAPLAEVSTDEPSRGVLARLTQARLITVGGEGVQVAHEALLREWPRLRGWLDADRDGRRLHQQVASAALEWDAAGRSDDGLLRGARLAAATDWQVGHADDLSALEEDYLTTSEGVRERELRAARRSARRLRLLAAGLAIVLVAALVAGGIAVRQRTDAAQRAVVAEAQALAGEAEDLAAEDVGTALLLSVEAHRRAPSVVTESALLATLDGARNLVSQRPLPDPQLGSLFRPALGGPLLGLRSDDDDTPDLVTVDSTSFEAVGESLAEDVGAVGWSGRGALLAVLDAGGARVLDPVNGVAVGAPVTGSFDQFQVALRDDATQLALVPADAVSTVTVHDTRTGAQVAQWDAGETYPFVEARPGSDELLVTTTGPTFATTRYRWDGTVAAPPVVHEGLINLPRASASPDGSTLALVTDTGQLRLLDVDSGSLRATLEPEGGPPAGVTWSFDSRHLAVGRDDGSIDVVAAADGAVEATITGSGDFTGLTFLDDDTLLATGDAGASTVALAPSPTLGGLAGGPSVTAGDRLSDDAVLVAVADADLLSTLRLPGAQQSGTVPLEGLVSFVDVTRDGRLAAVHAGPPQSASSTREPETLLLLDLVAGRVTGSVELGRGPFVYEGGYAVFSPDERMLAVKQADDTLQLYDAATLRPSGPPLEVPGALTVAPVWVDDGERLLTATGTGTVQLVDVADGSVRWTQELVTDGVLQALAATGDGRRVLVSDTYGDLTVLDGATGEVLSTALSAGSSNIVDIVLDETGSRLAALGFDGRLRLFDVASGAQLGPPLTGHAGRAYVILGDATVDGRVVTGGEDGVVAWPLSPAEWVARACDLVGRDLTREQWRDHLPAYPYRSTCEGVA